MVDVPADITTTAVLDTQDANLGTFSGALEVAGDHDWVKVSLTNGLDYSFYLSFLNTGSQTLGDSIIVLRDSAGAAVPLGTDDNSGVGDNSHLFFSATSTGTFFLDIGEVGDNNTGTYSLVSITHEPASINQTDGDDVHTTTVANERTVGGKGNDTLTLSANGGSALGEQGNDDLTGNDLSNVLCGGLGNDILKGNGGIDFLFGEAGNDKLFGGNELDILRGDDGNDRMSGNAGNDSLIGGAGKDFSTGGIGGDHFVFQKATDSLRGAQRDVINDFTNADDITLAPIDAKSGGTSNDTFNFIGTHAFNHHQGQLRFVKIDLAGTNHDKTIVQGDINGDGRADFEIELKGLHNLHGNDFLL